MEQDQDLAVAAAYAWGTPHVPKHAAAHSAHKQYVPNGGALNGEHDSYDLGYGELPSVDDLEVAAAAAAAAMEEAADQSSSAYSSEDEADSSSAESSSSEDSSSAYETDSGSPDSKQLITSHLFVTGSGEVKLVLKVMTPSQLNGLSQQHASESDTSSESDIEEITDLREMRDIISRMDDDDDDAAVDKDEAAAHQEAVEPLDVEIGPAEALLPAGIISSILQGTIVVQETENARALSEGTVLCSEERLPVGRIEDTFGPVMCPLYALRWAGQGEMPSSVAVGSPVFTTQKLAEYLLAEQLYTNGAAAENDLEEEEIEFSDDEKEAEYKRKLKAKRKQRDGLEADLGGSRAPGRGGRGHSRRGRMDPSGGRGGWSGGRTGGRGAQAFNTMQANATAGQMAGMQLGNAVPPQQSSGLPPNMPQASYAPPAPDASFQQGYAEGLRMAQQQLAQQHLQQVPSQQINYQQYWHHQQPPPPSFMGGPPPPYNPSIMPASPAMGPPPGWNPYGQPPQQISGQAANFFRGRGRGRRGGR